MKSLKRSRTLLAGAALGLMTLSAMAAPTLTIVDTGNNRATNPNHKEVTGDPGGTNYAVGYGTTNGPGVPSAGAGWPVGPGFGVDPSFPGIGTTGWHASYLNLSKDANVTFQFMGKGDASSSNSFFLDLNLDGDYLDLGEKLFEGGTTTACAMFSGITPSCDKTSGGLAGGQNEYTIALKAGRIMFAYLTGGNILLENSGAGLGNPDTQPGLLPGYFLGVDPYQASGQYQTIGSAIYAGLTDLPSQGDHDFQDLGVRISVVPEPSSVALAFASFAGLAYSRRNKKRV